MIAIQKNEIQLYGLVKKLSSYIDHSDYLGITVSYAIISGLIPFTTEIGLKKGKGRKLNPQTIEQFKFEEMKSIYSKLEGIIGEVKTEGDLAISKIMYECNPQIKELFDKDTLEKKTSILLKNIISNIDSEKHYVDNLRKKGITLVEEINKKGNFTRTYDFLKQDHNTITTALVPRVKYTL